MTTLPQWWPHDHADYDKHLEEACAAESAMLLSGGAAAALAFMRDTRSAHRRLFLPLTPPEFPEYAGTYRGTPNTSLAGREIGACFATKEGRTNFLPAHKVSKLLEIGLESAISELVSAPSTDGPDQLFERAAKIFYIFGLIHPYLDGNGHIQRLVFAAAVAQHSQLSLLPSWTIHPRPYDIEMAAAFEAAPGALGAVTQVLSPYVRR